MKSQKNNKVNPKGLKYLEIKDIKKERGKSLIALPLNPHLALPSMQVIHSTLGVILCHRTLRVALYVNYWNR